MDRGIFYLATEQKFICEARQSAASVRNHTDLPIAVLTRPKYTPDFADEIVYTQKPTDSFADKPLFINRSPFERTLYLDTDTLIIDNIDEIFDLLERYEFAAAQNERSYGLKGYGPDRDRVPALPEYNTGVLAYRKEAMEGFQKSWIKAFKEDQDLCGEIPPDQPSFLRAVYHSDIRIATLPRNYNCVFRRKGYLNGQVKILHGRLSGIESMGAGKKVDAEYAAKKLNTTGDPRIYDRQRELIRLVELDMNHVQYTWELAKDYGYSYAFRAVGEWVLKKLGMR